MYYSLSENYFMKFLEALKEEFLEAVKIGDIGEQVREGIGFNEIFRINIFGFALPFNQTTIGSWIAICIITVLAIWLGRDFKEIPGRRQVAAESFVGIFVKLCNDNGIKDEHAERVAPFVGSLATFICITNLTSLFKLPPPAKDPAFAITLAVFTIIYVIFTGIRLVGLKGFWGSLTYPNKALMPFKILDYFIKPISLSLRLFGNVFGAFILMEFIFILVPAIVPGILGIWFDLADGVLQAVVFSYLSIIYIGEIVEGAEHSGNNTKVNGAKKNENKKSAAKAAG